MLLGPFVQITAKAQYVEKDKDSIRLVKAALALNGTHCAHPTGIYT